MNVWRWPVVVLFALLWSCADRANCIALADEPAADEASATATKDAAADTEKKSVDDYEMYQALGRHVGPGRTQLCEESRSPRADGGGHSRRATKLDPYSNYISPEEMGRFKTSVESNFGGIGIQIAIEHEQLRILSPIVGSPAYRAGLQAGDRIVEIEGKSTDGLTIDDAVRKLKGEAGTSVTMTVIHPGGSKREVVPVKREVIHIDTVLGDSRKDNDTWNSCSTTSGTSATSA